MSNYPKSGTGTTVRYWSGKAIPLKDPYEKLTMNEIRARDIPFESIAKLPDCECLFRRIEPPTTWEIVNYYSGTTFHVLQPSRVYLVCVHGCKGHGTDHVGQLFIVSERDVFIFDPIIDVIS